MKPIEPHGSGVEAMISRRAIASWALFDWATQPFYTLILTFLFAPYFASRFIGDPVEGQALWGLTIGAGAAIVALSGPVLGAIADAGGGRKRWIAAFSIVMIAGMSGLWLAAPGAQSRTLFVLAAFLAAYIATELATIFTNAIMPRLAGDKMLGRLSGAGWALGYAGGLVSLLLLSGLIIADPETGLTALGLDPIFPLNARAGEGERLAGPFSALWYLVFALPFFLFTPDAKPAAGTWRDGLRRLAQTLRGIRAYRNAAWFLLARMLYADGLAAILTFGGIYAATLFGWGAFALGLFGVILTITGLIGCLIGGWADDRFGAKKVIAAALIMILIGAGGVLSVDRDSIFYGVAAAPRAPGSAPFASLGEQVYLAFTILIGLAVGPVQSASRSFLARLAPPEKMTEFFGLYAFSAKATAFAAPWAIAAVTAWSGSQRLGISVAVLFLVAGLALLGRVRA